MTCFIRATTILRGRLARRSLVTSAGSAADVAPQPKRDILDAVAIDQAVASFH